MAISRAGGLGRVGAVHEVLLDGAAPVTAEVAADRARQRLRRVRGAHQCAPALDHALPLDDGRHDRAGGHECDERLVEGLADVLGVVLLEQVARDRAQLERDEPVALRLDPAQHLTAQPPPDAVRLDQRERPLDLTHDASCSPAPADAAGPAATLPAPRAGLGGLTRTKRG